MTKKPPDVDVHEVRAKRRHHDGGWHTAVWLRDSRYTVTRLSPWDFAVRGPELVTLERVAQQFVDGPFRENFYCR